jgi:hypothetical protein
MAMLLSEKLGVSVTEQSRRSPEVEELQKQIRESMKKPSGGKPGK